jgi:aryl-alcohol dehydrogenase-like predicted oxidoreductase
MGGFDRPEAGSIEEQFSALAEMQSEGLIRHLGLSTVSTEQIQEAQSIAPIVCVQNFYNVANRQDDELIESLARQGIAYVPYFPLGGFSPLQSEILFEVAEQLETGAMNVALAWLLHRSPNILLIPGTSSLAHLRENVASASIELSSEVLAQLDAVGAE